MAGIVFKHKGNLKKTTKFLERTLKGDYLKNLDKFGREGVAALALATPVDTGKTAASWDYRIEKTNSCTKIIWTNSNVNNGVNIAIILQYGHGTNHGGYVQGRDYINPAIRPIFDKIADNAWKEVTKE
jgi:hypothetical protein